jgi:hypothetical protein
MSCRSIVGIEISQFKGRNAFSSGITGVPVVTRFSGVENWSSRDDKI